MNSTAPSANGQTVSTGVAGLDDILRGGLTADRLYLVEGNPGSGKTTLALQFLLDGVRRGEAGLYVTLSETALEIKDIAHSHGWSLEGVHIYEMAPSERALSPDQQLTMFHASELELGETTKAVLDEVERIRPRRVVIDSLSEVRLLAQNPLRYRRQILALKQYFSGRQSTVLLLDDRTSDGEDLHLQSIAHGVICLEQRPTDYGADRRQLRVSKLRGVPFRSGYHDMVIRTGGLDVFPRLVAAEHHKEFTGRVVGSGLPSLDSLLGGGLPPGSSTLLLGPAGCGKSTVALQFALAAAERGDRAALFIFDETIGMLKTRARSIGMPIDRHLESGLITVQQVDAVELSPGEFADAVRRAAEGRDGHGRPAKVLLIDSLNGYFNSMAEERQLTAQLHELFTYLSQLGVSTLVTVAQSGMVGTNMRTPIDTTYLADNVLIFRYFESFGQVRRAVSVVKKRSGAHELTIRELSMTAEGVRIGPPLEEFQGILSGIPTFHGERGRLSGKRGEHEE
jgi:circadian clock protein KaiC